MELATPFSQVIKNWGPVQICSFRNKLQGKKETEKSKFLIFFKITVGVSFQINKTEHQYAGDSIPTAAARTQVMCVSSEQEGTVLQQQGSSAYPAQSHSLIPSLTPALGLGMPRAKHLLGIK